MSRQLTIVLSVFFLLAAAGALAACNRQPERTAVEVEMPCTKVPDVPLHAKSGGEGDVRQTLAKGSKVTVLRTKEGWSLVRVNADRQSGWIESSKLGTCPSGSKRGGDAKRGDEAKRGASAEPAAAEQAGSAAESGDTAEQGSAAEPSGGEVAQPVNESGGGAEAAQPANEQGGGEAATEPAAETPSAE